MFPSAQRCGVVAIYLFAPHPSGARFPSTLRCGVVSRSFAAAWYADRRVSVRSEMRSGRDLNSCGERRPCVSFRPLRDAEWSRSLVGACLTDRLARVSVRSEMRSGRDLRG